MLPNESLWLCESDPVELLKGLYPVSNIESTGPQSRRSRLYLIACARKLWDRLPEVCRVVVVLGETYADATRDEKRRYVPIEMALEELFHSAGEPADLRSVEDELSSEHLAPIVEPARLAARDLANPAPTDWSFTPEEWRGVAALLYLPFAPKTPAYSWVPREFHDADLIRDIHGVPYRRVGFSPEWRTDTVMAFARYLYNSREFSEMPYFADALQDAGCNNTEILDHCRSGKPHARGCWVLDLVLEM